MDKIRVPVLLHIEVDLADWQDAYGVEIEDVPEDVSLFAADAVAEHLAQTVGGSVGGATHTDIVFLWASL